MKRMSIEVNFRQLLEDDVELAWLAPAGDVVQGKLPWGKLKLDNQAH